MKMTYSADVDAFYVYLIEGRKSARGVHVTQDWVIDVEIGGRVLGVEVFQASSYFTAAELRRLAFPAPCLPATSRLVQLETLLSQPAIHCDVKTLVRPKSPSRSVGSVTI